MHFTSTKSSPIESVVVEHLSICHQSTDKSFMVGPSLSLRPDLAFKPSLNVGPSSARQQNTALQAGK